MDAWVDRELDRGEFLDRRLKSRLGKLLGDLGRKIGGTVPMACQDWAATKAAYRFFDNRRVDEGIILAGHFAATEARFADSSGPMLVLHDTSEFSFRRDKPEAIGQLSLLKGRHATHTVCGLLMHSSLVLTTAGVPLGLAAVKFWTRKKFKGTDALKRKVNPTRIPIEQKESVRWLEDLGQATELLGEPARGVHRVEARDDHGRASTAELDVRFQQLTVRPPIGKQKRYPTLELTVTHADEREAPSGREPIRWRLLTNLAVDDLGAATGKLDWYWYAQRFKTETYHKVLKSGCRAEQARLRTAERLTNLLAVLCVVAWRVFWLTMTSRATPEAPAGVVLTSGEVEILDRLAGDESPPEDRTVAHYLVAAARLGGYLARSSDPPPGNMVIWRGLTRLMDIHLGFELSRRVVGN